MESVTQKLLFLDETGRQKSLKYLQLQLQNGVVLKGIDTRRQNTNVCHTFQNVLGNRMVYNFLHCKCIYNFLMHYFLVIYHLRFQ